MMSIAAFEIFKRWNKIIYPGLNNEFNKQYFINMVGKMLQDKYISEISKIRLLNLTGYINKL